MKMIKNTTDNSRILIKLILILVFLGFLIFFLGFKEILRSYLYGLFPLLYVSLLILILIFNQKWLKKDNNGEDLFLAFLLLLTLIFFDVFSEAFLNYENRPSSELGGIEKLIVAPSIFFLGFAVLITFIFFEIKLTKDKRLLRKILRKVLRKITGLTKNKQKKVFYKITKKGKKIKQLIKRRFSN